MAAVDGNVFPVVDSYGENGERVLFVDDGAIVDSSVDIECLSAEFRHRLGLLPEEEQELSEIFKSRLGLSIIDRDRLLSLIKDKEQTMRQYSLEKFAQKNFQTQKGNPNSEVKFINHQLSQPLLSKDNPFDFQASIYIFAALSRYIKGDFSSSIRIIQKPYIPLMMKIYKMMESFGSSSPGTPLSNDSVGPNFSKQESKLGKNKKQLSIKKLLRTIGKSYSKKVASIGRRKSSLRSEVVENSMGNDGDQPAEDQSSIREWQMPANYEDLLNSINWELELIQFIVAHGVIRRELRDEIFCQLCCQVKDNPSKQAVERAWVLHSLCSACFLPSTQLINHYISFIHQMTGSSGDRVNKIMHNLTRANETGFRFHPSNSVELKSEKSLDPIVFPVHLVDGRVIAIKVDSSCTSQDICEEVSKKIGLQDSFGFSLYVSAHERVSSMGCGTDHVMDAITECEYMALDRGETDLNQAPWVLSFRKELFTPWFDSSLDQVATELVYKQVKEGVLKGDLQVPKGIFETTLAQMLYIEYGELDLALMKRRLPGHLPKDILPDSKVLETVAKNVMDVATRLSLDSDSHDKNEIRCTFVSTAIQYLSANFSALFEAYNYGGFTQLPQQEVIVALNSRGVDILGPDVVSKMAHFKFSDLHSALTNSSPDLANLVLVFVAIDGNNYSLSSPNAEVAANLINAFLNGLRKRSRWAIAIKSFVYKDFRKNQQDNDFELEIGDTIELLNEIDERKENESEELLYGVCERLGFSGSFPPDVVYIIPTAHRPSQEFLDTLKEVGNQIAESSEFQTLKSRVIMSDADTIRRRPDSSA